MAFVGERACFGAAYAPTANAAIAVDMIRRVDDLIDTSGMREQ